MEASPTGGKGVGTRREDNRRSPGWKRQRPGTAVERAGWIQEVVKRVRNNRADAQVSAS